MSPLARGLLIALAQVLLVAGVGGKLLYDRERLPRTWVRTTGVDPVLPIRGRYVSLRLVIEVAPGGGLPPAATGRPESFAAVEVQAIDGGLRGTIVGDASAVGYDGAVQLAQRVSTPAGEVWTLADPVAFFLPEDAVDPTRLEAGDNLWAEVTVPPAGPPRPIRLEVRR